MKPSDENAVARTGSSSSRGSKPIDVAERGRFEDVELRVGGEQRIGDGAGKPISRQHDRGHPVLVVGVGQRRVLGDQAADKLGVVGVDGVDEITGGGGPAHGLAPGWGATDSTMISCCN